MKRLLWILGLTAGVALLLLAIHFINRGRMGYLTDLAYDPGQDRLYAAAGDSGLYVFSFQDSRLKRLSRFYDEGDFRSVAIQGTRAYVADAERGLLILDISGNRPRFISATSELAGNGLHLAGGLLYLAAGEQGLIIYSLADPDAPVEIGRYADLQDAWDVSVEGYLGYVADEPRGIEILNLSSPAQPGRIGFVTWDTVDAGAETVQVEGGFAYVGAGDAGLKIIDARNPGTPIVVAEYQPGPASNASGLAVHNWVLYLAIADDSDRTFNGLHIIDMRNPYAPQLLSTATYPEGSEGVLIEGETVFVANPWTGVRAYAVSDPVQPSLLDRFRYFP